MEKEAVNGADNVEEMDSPFVEVNDETKSINRTELMNKTAKELAVLAMPYVPLRQSTLEKMAKADLCDIIMTKGQSKEQKESKARASRKDSESEAIIETILQIVESFKIKREKEPLNATAKNVFKNNAINIVDKKVEDETVSSHGVNTAVAIITGGFLLVDGLIGIGNVPTLFSKLKGKLSAKKSAAK